MYCLVTGYNGQYPRNSMLKFGLMPLKRADGPTGRPAGHNTCTTSYSVKAFVSIFANKV
jgi:hypothetical protein